jgi:SanA protein
MILLSILTGKRMIRYVYIPVLLALTFVWISNKWVAGTQENCYNNIKDIPENKVGLVLGTSKTARWGPNLFFKYRIEAAVALFKAGKIKHIIVSGDNHIKEYNETEDMRLALMDAGVPDSCITMDYAGFRTLDSVVRCEKIFGQKKFTIISQPFHNERALFIAKGNGLECVGFNAKDVPRHYSLKTKFREYFARAKCVLDLYVLHTGPKFLGDEVKINV